MLSSKSELLAQLQDGYKVINRYLQELRSEGYAYAASMEGGDHDKDMQALYLALFKHVSRVLNAYDCRDQHKYPPYSPPAQGQELHNGHKEYQLDQEMKLYKVWLQHQCEGNQVKGSEGSGAWSKGMSATGGGVEYDDARAVWWLLCTHGQEILSMYLSLCDFFCPNTSTNPSPSHMPLSSAVLSRTCLYFTFPGRFHPTTVHMPLYRQVGLPAWVISWMLSVKEIIGLGGNGKDSDSDAPDVVNRLSEGELLADQCIRNYLALSLIDCLIEKDTDISDRAVISEVNLPSTSNTSEDNVCLQSVVFSSHSILFSPKDKLIQDKTVTLFPLNNGVVAGASTTATDVPVEGLVFLCTVLGVLTHYCVSVALD